MYESDEIVICDLCFSAVHQNCYKRELAKRIPERGWYCERCIYLMQYGKESEEARCILCPRLDGILVKWNGDETIWAHLTCLDWFPEVEYEDEE